jgi:hypothetical protein
VRVTQTRFSAFVRAFDWLAALALAVGTYLFLFVNFNGLHNDHFVMIARSFQVAHGHWPVRDFFDPGMPLAYLLPAAAMRAFGPTVLPEVVLQTAFFAATVGIVFLLARRASGSLLLAIALSGVVVALAPRLYNSSKVLIQAAALGIAWWYSSNPSTVRIAALGALTGVAFLFRHDYAVYIAVASVPLIAAVRPRLSTFARHAGLYALGAAVFVVPWLLYVQWATGVGEYFISAFRFSAAEGERTAELSLALALFAVLPLAALGLAWRGTARAGRPFLLFAGVFVMLVDLVLLRDGSEARVPDVVAASAIVAAVLAGALPRWSATGLGAALLAAVVGLWPLAWPLPPKEGILRASDRVIARLERWQPDSFPVNNLIPITGYLQRCTAPTTRVLVVGFGPQIPVYAHRPFAGGTPTWLPRYYEHPDDVRTALGWLEKETVGGIVMLEGSAAFSKSWPDVAEFFRARRFTTHVLHTSDTDFELWLAPPPPHASPDRVTGLPCGY